MKIKWIAIILAVAVALGAGLVAGIIIYNNMPENVLLNSVSGAINGFSERDEVEPLYNMLTGGSLEIETEELPHESEIPITDHVFSGKLYFSDDSKYMIRDLEYKNRIRGGEFSGDVYISNDFLYMKEEDYLNAAYGVKRNGLAKELKNSIFAYGSGSKYAIKDKEEYDRLIELYEMDNNGSMLRELEKITSKYMQKLWLIFCDNATISAEEKELTIDGKTDTYRVIFVRLKEEDADGILEDFYEFVKDDDSIPEFLDKYEEEFCRPIEKAYKIESLKQEWEDYVSELARSVDSIRAGKKEPSALEMINVELVTPKMKSTLLQFSISLIGEGYNGKKVLNIDCGSRGAKKADTISISSELLGIELEYKTIEDTKDRFAAQMSLSPLPNEDGEAADADGEVTPIRLFKVDFYKKAKMFILIFGPDEDFFRIEGKYQKKFRTTTLNISSIARQVKSESSGEPEITKIDVEIKAVLKESDRMPSAPRKYKKLSKITEEDMDRITDILSSVGID